MYSISFVQIMFRCAKRPISYQIISRFSTNQPSHESLFVNILGLKKESALRYVKAHKLERIDLHRLEETLRFFKTHDYNTRDLLARPTLFKKSQICTWEQYYYYLQECGFTQIPIEHFLHFRRLIYTPVEKLKRTQKYPHNRCVPEQLVTYLKPLPDNFDIEDLKDEELSPRMIHNQIIQRYLVYRLETTKEKIETLFRQQKRIPNKSLVYLCQNIDFALSLGYTKEKILRNGYIMSTHPRYYTEVLNAIPDFLGGDMRVSMRHYPKLIGIPLQTFYKIYDILKDYQIPDSSILLSMNVFTLAPTTIESRLSELKEVPELRTLMTNPKVLKMVVHYNRARQRLSLLQQIKLKCASLNIIGGDTDCFEGHIKEGKDVIWSTEVVKFVQNLLGCHGDKAIEAGLKKHPYFANIPFLEIEDTYWFLRLLGYTNEHIGKAVQILLYPKDNIKNALDTFKTDKIFRNAKPKLAKTQLLNIVLYLLEKDHHFNGNGVWRKISDEELM